MTIIRTYDELSKLKTFEDRFEYLKLDGQVGKDTFGFDRIKFVVEYSFCVNLFVISVPSCKVN